MNIEPIRHRSRMMLQHISLLDGYIIDFVRVAYYIVLYVHTSTGGKNPKCIMNRLDVINDTRFEPVICTGLRAHAHPGGPVRGINVTIFLDRSLQSRLHPIMDLAPTD